MTLEQLYMNLGNNETVTKEYELRRRDKIKEIANYINQFLREPDIAVSLAVNEFMRIEEMGKFDRDLVYGEIPGRYTRDGNPVTFLL